MFGNGHSHQIRPSRARQIAHRLTQLIFRVTKDESFRRDSHTCTEISLVAVSIFANGASGIDRWFNKELADLLLIAKASVAEVKSEVYVALDEKYLSAADFRRIYRMAGVNGRVIGGLLKYPKTVNIRGPEIKM